jgi:hypothetical protein
LTAMSRWAQHPERRGQIAGRHLITLMLLLGIPSMGLFSVQWSGLPTADNPGVPVASAEVNLNPPVLIIPGPDVSKQTDTQSRTLSARLERPAVSLKPSMLTAPTNPFRESLSAGVSHGVLVLWTDEQGVPTYGVPGTSYSPYASLSDRAILRQIRRSIGGASIKSPARTAALNPPSSEAADTNEENPFSNAGKSPAKEISASRNAAEAEPVPASSGANAAVQKEQNTVSATAQDNKAVEEPAAAAKQDSGTPRSDPPAGAQPPDAAPQPAYGMPAPGIGTHRPLAMLKMHSSGRFEAMGATTILNKSTFDTYEYGLMPMNVLFFPRPAEIGTSIAVADFNKDSIPDVCYHNASEGLLHVMLGNPDGAYTETMRIDAGTGGRSLAAGDFNGDGYVDIAVSDTGIGNLAILYLGEPDSAPQFRTFWLATYRDYIMSADRTGTGISDPIGATFENLAEVLDIGQSKGAIPGTKFGLFQVLNRKVANYYYHEFQLDAVLLNSGLSVNLQNSRAQMANILNVQAGIAMYFVIGDIDFDNTIGLALATPKK